MRLVKVERPILTPQFLLWPYHLQRGLLREGLEMLENLLHTPSPDKETTRRLLEGAGVFSQNLGRYLAAKNYARRCLDLSVELPDRRKMVKALNSLGWAEWRVGNYDQMTLHSQKALNLSEELEDEHGKATSLNNLAWANHYQGRFKEAEQLQGNVLQIHRARNDRKGIAVALAILPLIYACLLKFAFLYPLAMLSKKKALLSENMYEESTKV